jgi:DNA-binding beta-propeller fold protein YncE
VKKLLSLMIIALALIAGAFAQTTNRKYEVTFFGAPPKGQKVWNLPRSVAADGKGSIFVFRASDPPVLIFNRDGELRKSWGDGLFPDAHSIDLDREGNLWLTDRDGQMVYKYTQDGKQLMTLGKKGVAGDNKSTDTFNGPADVAIAANGDIFVADGHFNSRIVHFSKDGKFISIIGGTKGSAPGQFEVPHAIVIDSKGRLIVADEQSTAHNARIQIFDQSGKFIEQWTDIGLEQPTGLAITADDTIYVGDTDGNSVTILKNGKVIDVIGFLQARPHNIAIDPATGVIYLTDPPTPMLAGGIFGGAAQAAAPGGNGQRNTAAGSVDRTQERIQGGLVKQVIKKK